MKTTINILYKKFLFFVLAFSVTAVHSQNDDTDVKSLIVSKKFVFKAQSASPTSMAFRQLNGDNYDLKVFDDSLVSYLPYFGRAYSAPVPGANGSYNFTSTKFEYSSKDKRKGGWDITIKPKDVNDFREFSLTVLENGTVTLQALSNNRQLISYNGFITETK